MLFSKLQPPVSTHTHIVSNTSTAICNIGMFFFNLENAAIITLVSIALQSMLEHAKMYNW